MTLLQNQTVAAPLNVLHDQGIPNTLRGMSPPIPVRQMRLPVGVYVAVAVALVILIAILVGRLA